MAGAGVAGWASVVLHQRIRGRFAEVRRDWQAARLNHPRLVPAVAIVFAFIAAFSLGGAWFLSSLWRGLPDRLAIARIGEMDQATTVYDASDNLAFTIFKEQRIEVPLAEIDRKSTRLNSSHIQKSRMPSSA